MVDELVRMVGAMQGMERFRQDRGGAGRGRGHGPDRVVNGYWIRSATRIPPHPVYDVAGTRRLVRSPSDFLPPPILANSRARLPPLIPPPPPPPSPLPRANSGPARRFPASPSSSVSRSRQRQRQAAGSSAVIPGTIILPSSPFPFPPPPPPPPRPPRNNIHRRFFQRVFHMSQNTSTAPARPRSPSPVRAPSPVGTPPTPSSPPPEPVFSSHGSPSTSSIAETRARLPPPPEESPIPYRPPQRAFAFLNRPQ